MAKLNEKVVMSLGWTTEMFEIDIFEDITDIEIKFV